TIALPVGMYLLFGMLIGEQDGGQVRGLIMVNMAAYGGLGAAVTAGTQVQEDQRNGFLRQLIVAGMSPRTFLVGSVIAGSPARFPAWPPWWCCGSDCCRPSWSAWSWAWCSRAAPRWPAAWSP